MNRRFKILFLIAFISIDIFGQRDFSIGWKAGVNEDITNLSKSSWLIKNSKKYFPGAELLLALNYKLSRGFSIECEAGLRYEYYFLNLTSISHFSNSSLIGNFGFLSFDLIPLVQFETKRKIRYFVNTGPILGAIILGNGDGYTDKSQSIPPGPNPNWTYIYNRTDYSGIIKSKLYRFNFGFAIGNGVKIISPKGHFYTIEARYVFDPLDHIPYNSAFSGDDPYYHHILSLHFGMCFNINLGNKKASSPKS